MAAPFTMANFLGRWLFAMLLVFATYNPLQFSYSHWVVDSIGSFGPLQAIAGLVLIIGWIIFLRATMLSLGTLGIVLIVALLGCLTWLAFDLGLLSMESDGVVTWLALHILAFILAVGMSWSHIRRRLTGQVDVDDVEDGRG